MYRTHDMTERFDRATSQGPIMSLKSLCHKDLRLKYAHWGNIRSVGHTATAGGFSTRGCTPTDGTADGSAGAGVQIAPGKGKQIQETER
jgi:hypothetical protein